MHTHSYRPGSEIPALVARPWNPALRRYMRRSGALRVWLVCRDRGSASFRPPQQQYQWKNQEKNHSQQPEGFEEGEHGRLTLDHSKNRSGGATGCGGKIYASRYEI